MSTPRHTRQAFYNEFMTQDTILSDIVLAGTLLMSESEFGTMIPVLMEQSANYSHSDLACLYLYKDLAAASGPMMLVHHRGLLDAPESLPGGSELIGFLEECREAVVLLTRRTGPFIEILLNDEMNSGIVLPLQDDTRHLGALFFNSRNECHYGSSSLRYLDALARLAGGLLKNPLFKAKGIS